MHGILSVVHSCLLPVTLEMYLLNHIDKQIRDASLVFRTEPTAKTRRKTENLQSKTDVLRSIGKQSGESAESVLKFGTSS